MGGVEQPRERRGRVMRAVVVSDKMNKSRVAVTERLTRYPGVGKYVRRRTRVMFHDEGNLSKMGDEVLVGESRPLSRSKRFRLLEITRQARD